MANSLTKFVSQLPALPVFRRKGCVTVVMLACFANAPILAQAGIVGSDRSVMSIDVASCSSATELGGTAKLLCQSTDARGDSFQLAVLDGTGCGEDDKCQINGCQQTPDPDCPGFPGTTGSSGTSGNSGTTVSTGTPATYHDVAAMDAAILCSTAARAAGCRAAT